VRATLDAPSGDKRLMRRMLFISCIIYDICLGSVSTAHMLRLPLTVSQLKGNIHLFTADLLTPCRIFRRLQRGIVVGKRLGPYIAKPVGVAAIMFTDVIGNCHFYLLRKDLKT
jgi:hypothetical protein